MRRASSMVAAVSIVLTMAVSAQSPAKGSVSYRARTGDITVAFKFAYLVKGPDEIDPKVTIRRLILTSQDLEKRLLTCQTLSCMTDHLTEGVSFDVDPGPRMNYWMVLNNGLVQHADTEPLASLTTTTSSPTRLAGRIAFDSSASGGPKISAEFDAPLLKTVNKAR